jgi:hypothetical protein
MYEERKREREREMKKREKGAVNGHETNCRDKLAARAALSLRITTFIERYASSYRERPVSFEICNPLGSRG